MSRTTRAFLFGICIILSSFVNSEEISSFDIYYINGMLTSSNNAQKNLEVIKQALQQIYVNDRVIVELLYNDDPFFIKQLLDVFVERSGEYETTASTEEFWEYFLGDFPIGAFDDKFKAGAFRLGYFIRDYDIGPFSQKDLTKMITKVGSSIRNGKKVLIIPHSQGNFFYKNIHSAISNIYSIETQNCTQAVGLASPLARPYGNYQWINNSNDVVLESINLFYSDMLAYNVDVPVGFSKLHDDSLGHGIKETYLGYPFSRSLFSSAVLSAVGILNNKCITEEEPEEEPDLIPCGEPISYSGGLESYSQNLDLGNQSGSVEFDFEAFHIPDSMKINLNGRTVYSTRGAVSGYVKSSFSVSDGGDRSNVATVYVDGTTPGTAWNFSMACPGDRLVDKRVTVKYKSIEYTGAGYGSGCGGKILIDGNETSKTFGGSKSGTFLLTPGNHTIELVANDRCALGNYGGLSRVTDVELSYDGEEIGTYSPFYSTPKNFRVPGD